MIGFEMYDIKGSYDWVSQKGVVLITTPFNITMVTAPPGAWAEYQHEVENGVHISLVNSGNLNVWFPGDTNVVVEIGEEVKFLEQLYRSLMNIRGESQMFRKTVAIRLERDGGWYPPEGRRWM